MQTSSQGGQSVFRSSLLHLVGGFKVPWHSPGKQIVLLNSELLPRMSNSNRQFDRETIAQYRETGKDFYTCLKNNVLLTN